MSKKFSTPNSLTSILGSVQFETPQATSTGNGTTPHSASIRPSIQGKPLKVPLRLVRLNLNQPRKLLPPHLAKRVAEGLDLAEAMRQWAQEAKTELTASFNQDLSMDPRLRVIRGRAWSIYQHGLIEPVNVFANADGSYEIQNGECRTLAHAWLAACGEKQFDQIETVVKDHSEDDYTKKLVENLEREDLSAIEIGIGAWMARFEMSKQAVPDFNDLATFNRLAEIDQERESKKLGLVEWQAVEKALGKTMQWRWNATQAFAFPPQAIALVLQHRLNGRSLRPLFKLRDNPKLQIKVLQALETHAATQGNEAWTESSVASEIKKHLAKSKSSKTTKAEMDADAQKLLKGLNLIRSVFGTGTKGKQFQAGIEKLRGHTELVQLARDIQPVLESLLAK